MDIYMARQPIYDVVKKVCAYELLYRADERNAYSGGVSGEVATSNLVADAIAVFGLENITSGKRAFINFSKDLLLGDFPMLLNPDEVVIEVLEDTVIDDEVVAKLRSLKEQGYMIALDDYIGDESFEAIMEYIDVIKVDYSLVSKDQLAKIADRFKGKKRLLAEKIETEEDFALSISYGYDYFQGYYFSKPKMMQGKSIKLNALAYSSIITELGQLDPDFKKLSISIENNVILTFKLLQHANTMKFIQKERVSSIQMALVNMGLNEVRRWMLLMIAREFSSDSQDEYIKTAFIRAIFMEKLAMKTSLKDRLNEVFLMGTFSMLETISGISVDELVEEVPLKDDVKAALKGEEDNEFSLILDFAKAYELGDWDKIDTKMDCCGVVSREDIGTAYLECVISAEMVFNDKAVEDKPMT